MTMPFSPSKAVYNGNGVTVDFPFAFRVWKTSQLEVSVTDPQGMVQAVAGWTANITSTGGTVTYRKDGAPLPTGWKLAVLRNMPFEQNIDLISGTRFDPEVVERRLDEDAAERQQLKEAVDRSIKVPPTSQDPPELLADKIFEARDQAYASAAEAANSAGLSAGSAAAAAVSAAEAAETLAQASVVIGEDLADARATIATDKADAVGAIATDRFGAQTAISEDRVGAQTAIRDDRANAQAAIATDKADAVGAIADDRAAAQTAIASDRAGAQTAIALDKADALAAMSGLRDESLTSIQRAGDTQENRVNAAGAALVASGQDAINQINEAGEAQLVKIEATGSKTRVDVVLEGDKQVDRVTLAGAEYVKQTHEEAVKAEGEADRAEAAADRATSIADMDIASATNIGICPMIGEGLKVTILPDGNPRLDAISQVTVVSTPDATFAADTAIGYPYTLTMTSGTLIPGAKIAGYEVVVDGVTLDIVVADAEGVGSVVITPTGVDLTTGNLAYLAIDTEGNRSKIGYKTFLKHAVVARSPHVLSPLTGDTGVALLTPFQIQSFSIYGMPSVGVFTQLQVATDEAFTNIVYDSGESMSYTTTLTLVARLPDGVELFARARHCAETYGWSEWGSAESFTTVAITIQKPRIISPIAGAVNQPLDVAVVLSGLVTTGITAVPTNTRVIVARDEALTDRVFDTLESSAYATSVATAQLPVNTLLYFTGQHKDAELGWSPLADISTFKTLNAFVNTPSITSPTAVNDIGIKPTFTFSPFTNVGPADSHKSTRFQLSRNAGFTDLIVDTTITSGNKLTYTLTAELALLTTYYARVIFEGNTWGLSAWSATYVFQTLNAYINAPVITNISEGQTKIDPRTVVTVGAFTVTPTGFDAPANVNNVEYTFTNTVGGGVIEGGSRTLAAAGGNITPTNWLPRDTAITLKVKWIGVRLTSATTTINFKTDVGYVNAPKILSPAEGSVTTTLTPTITLEPFSYTGAADTPTRTRIYIHTDPDMVNYVNGYDGPYITSWTVPVALPINTKLYVFAMYHGAAWDAGLSTKNAFTTMDVYVTPPKMVAPADGATGVSLTPLLQLTPGTGVNQAITMNAFHLAENPEFSLGLQASLGPNTLATSVQITTPLKVNTQYWVKPWTYGAITAWQAGPVTSFRTAPATLTAAPITQPANGATGVALRPVFRWAAPVALNQPYTEDNVQIATDAGFTTAVQYLTAGPDRTAQVASNLNINTVYYARAYAKGAVTGHAFGPVISFRTLASTLGIPVITAPTAAATGVSLTPLVIVANPVVVGQTVSQMQIQISTSNVFANITWDSGTRVYSQSITVGAALGKNTVYYVRVRLFGSVTGWTAYSATVQFTTASVAVNDVINFTGVGTTNWTVPITGRWKLECVGGGMGSGVFVINTPYGSSETRYAGCGGGYSIKKSINLSYGAIIPMTVGGGGGGDHDYAALGGYPGGTSSCGAHCSATGGEFSRPGAGSGGDENNSGGGPTGDNNQAIGGLGHLGYGQGANCPPVSSGVQGFCRATYLGG